MSAKLDRELITDLNVIKMGIERKELDAEMADELEDEARQRFAEREVKRNQPTKEQ